MDKLRFDYISLGGGEALATVITSTATYGINIALCASCLYFLNTAKRRSRDALHKILNLYIIGMFAFATHAAVNVAQYVKEAAFHLQNFVTEADLTMSIASAAAVAHNQRSMTFFAYHQEVSISVPLIITGADAFMVSRTGAVMYSSFHFTAIDMEMLRSLSRS